MNLSHKIYLNFSEPLIELLAKKGVTPNQITVFNLFLGVFGGGFFFSLGMWWANWIALFIMFISVILDYVDGDLAKTRNMVSKSGIWLDNSGDIILQNVIMGAIALGVYTIGLPVFMIVLFFITNITLNMVSLYYNMTFGFDSYNGNSLFREYMDAKNTLINRAFKNILDPTASRIGIFLFTIRYWIILGVIFNSMGFIFVCITLLTLFRSVFMFVIYTLHLLEYKKLWLLQALAIIDAEREEFYKCRMKS